MHLLNGLASGVVGAVVLTAVHEAARQVIPGAPRVDVIGKRAISRPLRAAGYAPPRGGSLYGIALGAEVVSNSLYYALVAAGDPRKSLRRGLVLGLVGGIGAVALPPLLGLGQQPHRKTPATELMTVAWYTLAGIAAGATHRALARTRTGERTRRAPSSSFTRC